MSLKQQLTEDMKQAMRDRDSLKLNTIRFLMSEVKNLEIDQGEADDQAVQKVVVKLIKSMNDAIGDFERGGRTDIVEEEKNKIKVLEAYLPEQMSDEDLGKIVGEVIAANPDAQMGQLIGQVMAKVQGKADGKRVASMVNQHLS